MTERTAKELAAALGGDAVFPMPGSRTWGVLATCPDGRFVAIEDGSGWAYRDRAAYEAWQASGDDSGVVAAGEWPHWGVEEGWARSLAGLLGGEPHQSGGNIWVVLFQRSDGRFIVVGDDGADIYQSADHYERYYEAGQPEPEYVCWGD
jgi:hypothetical protein